MKSDSDSVSGVSAMVMVATVILGIVVGFLAKLLVSVVTYIVLSSISLTLVVG
ncbi:hypothetical protein RHMOL_Rhmol13G0169600 [Rhododendron molle]|uniref:Uncharacterized protein n=1 Tax=Rhododendron molle TaxID=49168 RepID=A0ACC0L7M1_RHOML|nr:hypothetical protein RHMOL_Rhmol13G0169600 [Rhododendron molle]